MMKQKVTVIGGGAAGMVAALFAARSGAKVTLLERNEKLGKKIYITGKGRCNVTNTAENPMQSVVRNPRFLYSAFACLDSVALREILSQNGCPTMVERGGRVFPVSEKASDVTKALQRALNEAGVEIRLNSHVASIQPLLQQGPVILATGGLSYPSTGSTGDGYTFAKEMGHSIAETKPSLIPLITEEAWHRELQGVSLKNVRVVAKLGKKTRFDEQGEMLFTHFGVSGPLILSLSAEILDDPFDELKVSIDLKPALDIETLEKRIVREVEAAPNKQLVSLLSTMEPARLAAVIPAIVGMDATMPANQLTRPMRRKLAEGMKSLPITVKGTRSMAEAIITRGGVSVKEVDARTMESKLCPGLYFAGEMLDVDARTGGYNLQIAFSTGALAGKSAAESIAYQE